MTTMAEAGRTRVEVPDFDSWVAARGPALLRLAYVLTGNGADAEDVVQDALSRALPRWSRISTVDDLARMDLAYAPPFATAWEILQVAARRVAERL